MPNRIQPLALVACVALAAMLARLATTPHAASAAQPEIHRLPTPPVSTSEAEQRERDIAFFSGRAARDPLSAADRERLAGLYLDRSRETGDFTDVARAEQAARASLALRDGHNTRTRQLLASILMAQHRFAEAVSVARELAAENPDVETFRALFGECQLEVGDYAGADTTFAPLARQGAGGGSLAVVPRLARWHELSGRTEQAKRLLLRARDEARRTRVGMTREQRAWFELRVGDLALRHGDLAAADSAIAAGLADHPGDYRLLALEARLDLARGRTRPAIEHGEAAVAVVLDPATLGLLADAYASLGDSATAREYAHGLETAVSRQPGAYHRAWSLWLLDHDRDVRRVSTKIERELRSRRDVYGLDLEAWSLHKRLRDAEARSVMAQAMGRGTEDAILFEHAAAIDAALGDSARARAERARARRIDPYFERIHGVEPRVAATGA